VSIIGSLEQFNLSNILQKIEVNAKTGLLIIKQGKQWVELTFRQGQLMCIGPVRSNKTLGERLLQAGVISQQALQGVAYALGASQQSETGTAITLIDLGYLNQGSLYAWAAREASRVLQVLLTWTTGEIYFEEGLQPPADRLLIALSVASLLPQQSAVSSAQPVRTGVSSFDVQEQPKRRATSSTIPEAPTLHSASQFFDASAFASISAALGLTGAPVSDVVRNTDALSRSTVPVSQPQQVTEPLTPRRIDTSFMQPQMVLIPTDLSGLRERNLQVQLTPEQWRLFTRADGHTSLQMACQLLGMPRELVCQVAGELIALGLVTIFMPASGSTNDQSPVPQDVMNLILSNSNFLQANGNINNPSAPAPIETQSQWGNGGNGATFVLGGGWVVTSSPSQPLQPSGPHSLSNQVYAQVR
jgi:uncharacterized protein DUF4388